MFPELRGGHEASLPYWATPIFCCVIWAARELTLPEHVASYDTAGLPVPNLAASTLAIHYQLRRAFVSVNNSGRRVSGLALSCQLPGLRKPKASSTLGL